MLFVDGDSDPGDDSGAVTVVLTVWATVVLVLMSVFWGSVGDTYLIIWVCVLVWHEKGETKVTFCLFNLLDAFVLILSS